MPDSTQKSERRSKEPVSGTFEALGVRAGADRSRDSRPDRAWPVPAEPRPRESIAAPRPSHAPAVEWTLDAALRAAAELDADLREQRSEPAIARAFVDALEQVLPGIGVSVRVFTGPSGGWFVASGALSTAVSGACAVGVSRAALGRARALVTAPFGPSSSGPALEALERARPILEGSASAVDALAVDDGVPVAIVTLESPDESATRGLEPLAALFADRLAIALSRFRASQNEAFLRRYLQEMFEHSSGPIVAIAPDRTVRALNRPALRLIDQPIEAVLGRDVLDLVGDTQRARVEELFSAALAGRATANFELRVRRKDGTIAATRWNTATITDEDGSIGAVVAMGEDLSDVQRLEQQILHAEKLATLGQLAAGVLHELNNPLTSVTVYSEYLLGKGRRTGADAGDLEKLARIVESAARMTKFTRELVTYARPSTETPTQVSMIDVIEQSLGFCEHLLDEAGVLVERSYAEDLPPVEAVRSQLQQIFVNLVTNATQAMASDPRPAEIDAPRPTLTLMAERRGDHVVVRVGDNGPGIPPEHLPRIFEPFFTTKGEGKGTGLGLSIVRNLVEQHGGTISVESRVAGPRRSRQFASGTTFELRFRAA